MLSLSIRSRTCDTLDLVIVPSNDATSWRRGETVWIFYTPCTFLPAANQHSQSSSQFSSSGCAQRGKDLLCRTTAKGRVWWRDVTLAARTLENQGGCGRHKSSSILLYHECSLAWPDLSPQCCCGTAEERSGSTYCHSGRRDETQRLVWISHNQSQRCELVCSMKTTVLMDVAATRTLNVCVLCFVLIWLLSVERCLSVSLKATGVPTGLPSPTPILPLLTCIKLAQWWSAEFLSLVMMTWRLNPHLCPRSTSLSGVLLN